MLAEDVHAADWGPMTRSLPSSLAGSSVPLGNAWPIVRDRCACRPMVNDWPGRNVRRTTSWGGRALGTDEARGIARLDLHLRAGLGVDGTAVFVSGMGRATMMTAVSRIEMDGTSRTVLRSRPRVRVLDAAPRGSPAHRPLRQRGRAPGFTMRTPRVAAAILTWLGNCGRCHLARRSECAADRAPGATLEGGRRSILYPIYVRPTDGGPAALLGNGYGHALSDDGRWALTSTRGDRDSKIVRSYPLGPGPARTLDNAGLDIAS